MHKSKATSTPTSTSSSTSTAVQGSQNKGKTNNTSGSYSVSDCESISLNVGGSGDNDKSGVRDLDDGGKHDKDPSSVQPDSQQQANRPPLDRQGEIGSAPLATFDTVDLSDEEVTNSKDTASANTEVVNNSDLPHASIVDTTSKTSLTVTTNTNTKEAASNELVHTVCSIPAAASKISTAETTTSTVTIHNKLPLVSSCLYKESHIAASSDVTSDDCSRNADVCQSNSPNSKSSKELVPVNASKGSKLKKKQKIKNAASKTLSPSPSKESRQKKKTFFGRKTNASDIDGEKDSEVVSKQSEVVNHQLVDAPSSDDDADGRTYRGVSPEGLDSPSSFATCKTDNLLEVIKGQQESVTVPSATDSVTDLDFVNFDTTEDGTATSVATEPGSGPKLKDVSAVEKVNLLDDSSSSESDLSAAESLTTENLYSSLAAGRETLKLKEVDDIGQQFDNFTEPHSFSSKRKAYERRLQRLQVKTTPINRPRSATPLSVVTLDEYTHLSSPEVSPNLEKLKIVLPSEQFGKPIKSPRGIGASKENAFDFNEDRLFRHTKEAIVLQSDGSIGQSPRRIFIPPTLSPSQSPCKAAAGSPVSKLVLVSKLPAGTSPLVKSAASTASTSITTSITTTLPTSNPSLVPPSSSAPKCSVKKWEQFDDNTACTLQTVECSKLGPNSLEGSHSRDEAVKPDGKEQIKSKLFTAECSGNIEPPLVGYGTHLRGQETEEEEEEEEEILKVEIGSSDVGKAYNIELEVPTKDKMDISHNKPNC